MSIARNSIDSIPLSLIRRHALFADLTTAHLKSVLSHMLQHEFPENAEIVTEGNPGEALFLILEGSVVIYKNVSGAPAGSRAQIAELGRGETFGEMAMLDNNVRSATVTTREPTVLLSLSRENLENFDEMDPTIYTVILKNLAKNLSSRIRVVDDAFAVVLFSSQEREQVETAN